MNRAELIAALEATAVRQDDGGYALDGEIARLKGWKYSYREGTHSWGWCRPDMPHHYNARPPAFTTSIDAAMTLVAADWEWALDNDTSGECTQFRVKMGQYIEAEAKTLPLALCIAALRAGGE